MTDFDEWLNVMGVLAVVGGIGAVALIWLCVLLVAKRVFR